MTREDFTFALARMDGPQLEALSVCIMAERRLRHLYPRDPQLGSAIEEAYEWTMTARSIPLRDELAPILAFGI